MWYVKTEDTFNYGYIISNLIISSLRNSRDVKKKGFFLITIKILITTTLNKVVVAVFAV